MSGWTLRAKQSPALRVDLRGITPNALAALDAAAVERLPVGHGNALVPLGEFFQVEPRTDDHLVFAADLARFDRVGWQMDGGRLDDQAIAENALPLFIGGLETFPKHFGSLLHNGQV